MGEINPQQGSAQATSGRQIRLTTLSTCAGWASKLSAEALAQVLRPIRATFQARDYPDLLVGLDAPDDAAVWKIADDLAMVVTTDFFTPVVDDAFDYGQIAAANALSDLYAMNARPIFALNVAAMPPDIPVEVVGEIIRGGAEKVAEAGAVIAGGHTIQDKEPKYGLVGVGLVDPTHMFTKAAVQAGDVLVITKPLGMGVTTTALKQGKADPVDVQQAVAWMRKLNQAASVLAATAGVRAATDITGYSLLGHGCEMAQASQVRLRMHLPNLPFLAHARNYAEGGFFPGGSADNRMYFGPSVDFEPAIDEYAQMMLFDAQTSGGLLLAVPVTSVEAFLQDALSQDVAVWPVGEAEPGEGVCVKASPYPLKARFSGVESIWYHAVL